MSGEVRVAFQGEPGAYSDEALAEAYPDGAPVPCRTLREVFALVEHGAAAAGIVPVENAFAGSINETYDLLLASPLTITGEVMHHVDHCLLALPGVAPAALRRVFSHPQALAQCDEFLRRRGLEPVPEYDTAGAARRIAAERSTDAGAIAGRRAAQLYGLAVVAESIQNTPQNLTRFLLLAREPAPAVAAAKTSIVFATANVPGALYQALGAFARRNLNLSKLESRPARERPDGASVPWEYVFYVDVEAHEAHPAMVEALADLQGVSTFLRVLGSYPRAVR